MAETYCAQYKDGLLVLPPEKLTNSHMAHAASYLGPHLLDSPIGTDSFCGLFHLIFI